MLTDVHWLGLCLRSESNYPHEWFFIGCVVRNRVEGRRFDSSYYDVITAPYQFSYFNQFRHLRDQPEELYAAAKLGYAGDSSGWTENDLVQAEAAAIHILSIPRWQFPFSHRVYHFWSLRSMNPPGREPSWAREMARVFTPAGIDPWRFKFGES